MFGFINLNKPEGFTSHDCVACVRRILRTKRVGHGGTLDPLATGVLPIAVGPATRLLQFLVSPKAYRATLQLGVTTSTDDLAGDVLQIRSALAVTRDQITAALTAFTGQIQQVPPIYSAIHVNGRRLYELARQGTAVQPAPRSVEIHSIEILDWQTSGLKFPELTLQIACGPGTYIRSIARDLGEALQTGGTLAQLIRTQSCGFELAESLSLKELEHQAHQGSIVLIDPDQALSHLASVRLDPLTAKRWCQGKPVEIVPLLEHQWYKVHGPQLEFLGLGQLDQGMFVPKVVLSPQSSLS